jgi:hypothetical protein
MIEAHDIVRIHVHADVESQFKVMHICPCQKVNACAAAAIGITTIICTHDQYR